MLVSELKAKVKKRGIYYNKWFPVYKFKGSTILVYYFDEKLEFKLSEIDRIEP